MKKLIFYILVLFLFSCSKNTESNTIVGKWRLMLIMDDVHGEKINNPDSYIQFKRDGTFIINSAGVFSNSSYILKNLDHYILLPNDQIKYYNKLTGDSIVAWYGFHNGLYLSYGYMSDSYIRTP